MKKKLDKKIAIFTSCSANYLAKATALSNSVRSHNFTIDFHLIYCDRNLEAINKAKKVAKFTKVHDFLSLNISESEIFKFDVMELCTKLKANVLKNLDSTGEYEYIIYLDPDAYCFEPIDEIVKEFADCNIGLTPHFSKPISTIGESFRLTELSVLRHGIYNLGFLFLKKSDDASKLADWWLDRLNYNCYDDPLKGKFTDQRTFDIVPVCFDGVKVSKIPSVNTASWNLHERILSISEKSGSVKYFVDDKPLLMYHFSGVNSKGVSDFVIGRVAPDNISIRMLENWYKNLLNTYDQEYFEKQDFFGDHYCNGKKVSRLNRRLYAANIDLQQAFPKPYSEENYFSWLVNERKYLKNEFPLPALQIVKADILRTFDFRLYSSIVNIEYANDADGFRKCLTHYSENCATGKFNPNRFFDTNYLLYSQDFPLEVRPVKSGAEASTPLYQYLVMGSQGRYKPNRFFDELWYLERYPDVAALVEFGKISNGFVHYCAKGCYEGKDPGPLFSESRYLSLNPDVMDAVKSKSLICGFEHFHSTGLKEGREF